MRRFVPLMAVSLLGGCGVIPPAVSLASYAIDGVSLLTSGKTISDHALSAAAQQDCVLFRAAQNLEVCTDWGSKPQMASARPLRSPLDRDDPASQDEQAPGALPVGETAVIADRGDPMELPRELADVAQALPGVAKVEAGPVATATLFAPPKPTAPVQPAAKLSMTALVPSSPVASQAGKSQAPDVATLVRSDDTQARRDAVRAAYEGRYLMVLGSFKGPEMAGRLAKLQAHLGAKVVKVDVQGESFYRVVVEPTKGAMASQKLTGSDKPWLMPASQIQTAGLAGTLR